MRIFRRGWTSTRRLMVLAAWVLVSLAFLAPLDRLSAQSSSQGQSPSSSSPPADQEWTVRDSQGFRSRNLSLGSLFQIRLDGRTLSPTWSSDRSSSSSSTQKTDGDKERKPLDTKVEFQAEYPVKPVSVVRHMRLDPKRRAVRILDVFTNSESQERTIRIDYQTYLSERGGTRFGGVLNQAGESREYGNGVPDDTVTALIFAERQDSSALPLFVWGQSGARWPVSVQDISSNVSLSYEGTVPANGKVALLHWVAVAGQDKSVKIERTSDLFWRDGRLIDPMVPPDIAPLVVNFTPESLKASAPTADTTSALASGRLIHLEELCGKLSVSRDAKDVLWMGKDEQFSGTLTGSAVQLRNSSSSTSGNGNDNDDRAIEIPLADIAGIRGGGGRGREHRVYLRNGAVLTGRASLKDCRLAGELGDLTLDADALELLLMRVTSADGKAPPAAIAFAELQNGALYWLGRQGEGSAGLGAEVQLVTVFGSLPLSLNEIWSLERRTEPPFNLVTILPDGSRIHGVARQPALPLPVLGVDGKVASTQVRTAELVRFGAGELLSREMALPDSNAGAGDKGATNASDKAKTEPPPRYCWLRDGSLLVGTIASPALSLRTGGNEVELKTEDILRMTFDTANGNLANIELRSGAKMQGELVSESVEWQLGSRKITLPVGWLQEVMRKDPPAPPEPPAPGPTVRAPGENDPLALPPGFAKEELVEMKVEYPPATAEGPLRVWGTLSLPRLDKCDEASVKPRLTFLVPKGTANVALKKPLTVSAPDSVVGVLTNINDGSAKDDGGDHVAIEGGLQWVQIDLQKPHHIWKVLLWHYHRMPVVYQDVIVQVSDDPAFKNGVKTLFNNDHDNSSGLGKGPDTAYVETNYGWLMDGAGAQGRYIRFYSQGNSYSEKNDYLETMVFGTPARPGL